MINFVQLAKNIFKDWIVRGAHTHKTLTVLCMGHSHDTEARLK